ncbi:MAG: hypothetical protein ACRD3D_00260 [Terriglobia bacterium]
MIEQKLIVGRYIELNTPQPVFAGAAANGFQRVTAQVLHIDTSQSSAAAVSNNPVMPGFNPGLKLKAQIALQRAGEQVQSQFNRQRVSTTGAGAVAKAHRNFVWLEWLGGVVSEVNPNGIDVLTGPMSGCWILSYLRAGVRYVGHVGTVMLPTDPQSIAARAAWNNFAPGVHMAARAGFNPFNDPWLGPATAGLPGEAALKTFALVTSTGTFYTVRTYPQLNKPTRIRIAGIQQNPSTLPANGLI